MMTQTHGPSGAALWLTGDALTRALGADHPYYLTLAGAVIALAAAKAPDIDNPDSHPAHVIDRFIPGASRAVNTLLGHRGATHWISTGIFLGASIGFLASLLCPAWWVAGLAVTVGWTAHIAGDCCTYQGAPACGPFRRASVRLPYGCRVETGGITEITLVHPAIITWAWMSLAVSSALAIFN